MTEPAEPYPWMVLERELHAEVARLKAEGVDPVRRADATAEMRSAAGRARSDAFAQMTQGKGKPMKYGTGEAPEEKKKKARK